jgi:hypothetical protein
LNPGPSVKYDPTLDAAQKIVIHEDRAPPAAPFRQAARNNDANQDGTDILDTDLPYAMELLYLPARIDGTDTLSNSGITMDTGTIFNWKQCYCCKSLPIIADLAELKARDDIPLLLEGKK